jgi:hypothetical protein
MLLGLGILTGGTILMAQDMEQHRWNSRLLLIQTNELESDDYQNQISILKEESAGLEERRLVVYTFWKDKYRVGFENEKWKLADTELTGWTNPDSGFEIILIGLDGEIKLRQDEVVDTESLFARIDAMPMRRQEIKNSK